MDEKLREAFEKVKKDIDFLTEQIVIIKRELEEIKLSSNSASWGLMLNEAAMYAKDFFICHKSFSQLFSLSIL